MRLLIKICIIRMTWSCYEDSQKSTFAEKGGVAKGFMLSDSVKR